MCYGDAMLAVKCKVTIAGFSASEQPSARL